MKDEDIDKIFRDALADQKAPTAESDWDAFEGMLNSRKGGGFKWIPLFAILLLLGGGATAYYFLSEPEVRYVSRAQTPENFSPSTPSDSETFQTGIPGEQANVNDRKTAAEDEKAAAENRQTEGAEKTKSPANSRKNSERVKRIKSVGETQQSVKKASIENPKKSDEDKEMKTDGQRNADVNKFKPDSGNDGNSSSTNPDALTDESNHVDSGEEPLRSPDRRSSSKSATDSDFNAVDDSNSAVVFNSATESGRGLLEKLPMLGTDLSTAVNPNLRDEQRKIEPQNHPLFVPFIYFKLEQNNVLRTSPAIGIGLQRNLALPGKGCIAVKAGIGYQRTGRLAWEQSSQTVTYGFDRYVEASNLKTDNLGMIQIPLRLSYQTGVHRIFAGAEINWVVNASQSFRRSAEGPLEDGYLYASGAPKNAVFWQVGYGYAMNEKLELDLGINMAGGKWNPAGKRPFGGFIRLNYFIR